MKKSKLSLALAFLLFVSLFTSLVTPILARGSASTISQSEAVGASVVMVLYSVLCLGIFIILPMIGLLGVAIQIFMIIDVFTRDFGAQDESTQKALWVLLLLFAGFPIGAIVYYALVMQKYPKK